MKRGFSLIELMVVIAIVAVLSAFAVPAYMGYVQRANMTKIYNEFNIYIEKWNQVTNTGDWPEWFNNFMQYSFTSDSPAINSVYLGPQTITLTFNPGYFNREATTYVSYIPVLDGVLADENIIFTQINNAKIITWQCSVSGVDGSYGGYSVEEFRQEYFPNCY